MTQKLFERYEIVQVLGHSAEAQTLKAHDLNTHRQVVVKHIRFGRLNSWKRLELFQREAKVLASLQHPQIPQLRDFRILENEQSLEAYLVYDWIEGQSLAEKIKASGLPQEQVVLKIAEQVLWILHYLHAFFPPIVHRDIKPSNLILSPDKTVYLIDFGGAQQH